MIGYTFITCWSAATALRASSDLAESVFMASEELQDAVIRNVEVIGEAAKRVSMEARGRLSPLDWKAICGMRDVLIHDYIGVDLDEVWNVASSRIPELQTVLEQFLASEGTGSTSGS
jgi:uncharacterized protein with HEPN domain